MRQLTVQLSSLRGLAKPARKELHATDVTTAPWCWVVWRRKLRSTLQNNALDITHLSSNDPVKLNGWLEATAALQTTARKRMAIFIMIVRRC